MPTELPLMLVTIIGVVSPVIYQLVTRYIKSEMGRFLVVIGLSAVTGVAAMFLAKVPWVLTPEFLSILYTFTSISFKVFWKPLFQGKGTLSALKAPATTY